MSGHDERRDNGVDADDYAFLGTAAREVADDLLRELADEGVAAYAVRPNGAPAGDDEAERDGHDADERLYVDRTSVAYARRLLLRRVREGARDTAPKAADDENDDEAWERLLAEFHAEPADGPHPWPDAEDVAADANADTADADADADRPKRRSRVVRVQLDRDEPDDEDEVEDEDHFVKPEPPELPRGDVLTKVAWAVMLLAIAYPILSLALHWPLPGWLIAVCVVVFIAGIVTHVARIRDPRSDEPGSDDGAVV